MLFRSGRGADAYSSVSTPMMGEYLNFSYHHPFPDLVSTCICSECPNSASTPDTVRYPIRELAPVLGEYPSCVVKAELPFANSSFFTDILSSVGIKIAMPTICQVGRNITFGGSSIVEFPVFKQMYHYPRQARDHSKPVDENIRNPD